MNDSVNVELGQEALLKSEEEQEKQKKKKASTGAAKRRKRDQHIGKMETGKKKKKERKKEKTEREERCDRFCYLINSLMYWILRRIFCLNKAAKPSS